jgi:type IV fimbrial biogenesis protein FimT
MDTRRSSRRTTPGQRRAQAGVTLVESMITVTVLGAVTSLAVPGFDSAIQRRHLEGAAAQLETDIQHARMLAITRSETLRISFENVAGGSCYVIHRGAANQCGCNTDGSARCEAGATAERSVFFTAGGPLSLTANSRSVAFDPLKGTVTPTATVRLSSRNGMQLHQVVNLMGRVRSCTPTPALSGYKPC